MNLPISTGTVGLGEIIPIINLVNRKTNRLLLNFKDIMGNASSAHKTKPARPASVASEALSSTLALGAGCYWGTEKYVRKDFQKKFPNSIKTATVGFMSPLDGVRIQNPTYPQVCSGQSGHIEVLFVELNEPDKHFEELIRFFFQFHDPTTKDRQGNDRGFQYASWIFCDDEPQALIAERVRGELQTLLDANALNVYDRKTVSTKISPMKEFTPAQAEHQEYLAKHPNGYCNHRIRFKHWPVISKKEGPSN